MLTGIFLNKICNLNLTVKIITQTERKLISHLYGSMVNVKLSMCLTKCHEGVWGSGYKDPHFLDLGTSWR
jgi:hypothetical protein